MERKRQSNHIKQIVSVAIIFIVLIVIVLIGQHPYIAYADTATCPAPAVSEASASIAVDGPATITPGASYAVTVKEHSAVSTYSNYSLGFAVSVIPSAGNNLNGSVEIARVTALQANMLTPSTDGSARITWTAPQSLLSGTYQFAPLVMAGGGYLSLAPVDPVTIVAASTNLPAVYLDGTAPVRIEASNGSTPPTGNTEQELVRYYLDNSTAVNQNTSLRVRVWTGEPGSLLLARSESTYSQSVAPGRSISRQYFIDTTLFGSGTVEADLTANGVTTTQWFNLNGTLIPGVIVSTFTQTGHGLWDAGISHTAICLAASSSIAPTAIVRLTLTDATQATILSQTVEGSDLKSEEYTLNEYALNMHWPITVVASVSVKGTEVSRYTNTYQP